MPKVKKQYPIRFDGSDSDFLYFSTPSWSQRGVRYDIKVCKRSGFIACDCMDSTCRHKNPNLVPFISGKESERACKHQRLLRESYFDLLGGE